MSESSQDRVSLRDLLRLYRVFWKYYVKNWRLLLLSFTGMVLTVTVALAMPWPLKLILDHVIWKHPLPTGVDFLTDRVGSSPQSLLIVLVLAFIALRLLSSVVTYLYRWSMLAAAEMIAVDIRQHVFAQVQRLSLSFHGESRAGDLVYRLTSDVEDIKLALIQLPQMVIYRLFAIGSTIAVMLLLEWRLALIAFSILPVLYYFHLRIGTGVRAAAQTKKAKESDVSSVIAQNVTAMALVQAYGREDLQQQRFRDENRQSLEAGIAAMRLSKKFKRGSDVLVALGTAGVAFYGGSLALEQAILPGTLILFADYLRTLYRPIEKLAAMMLRVVRSQVSARRLMELADCDLVVEDSPQACVAPPFRGRVEFEDVNFHYSGGPEVLEQLNFAIEPGRTVALVGPSGAGKTTLVGLLLRFHDPTRGRILIDGQDLRHYTLRSLREQIAVLMQDSPLLSKTVRDNIGFGRSGATEDEIVEAAKLAQAHEFILGLPDGYDTMISEGGENLSGGQIQRIHIARAIVRDAPIVILDEPTTALDARATRRVQEALGRLMRGKTAIVVAHSFSTVADADQVLVLVDGKIEVYSSHHDAWKRSIEYRDLHESQFGKRVGQCRS